MLAVTLPRSRSRLRTYLASSRPPTPWRKDVLPCERELLYVKSTPGEGELEEGSDLGVAHAFAPVLACVECLEAGPAVGPRQPVPAPAHPLQVEEVLGIVEVVEYQAQ